MSWLRLIGLTCSRTQESEDEVTLKYTSDWVPSPHGTASHSTVSVMIARTMDVGDSVTLLYTTEFEHAGVVTLWESDRNNPDDFVGLVMVTPDFEGSGERTLTFERSGLGSYSLTCEVTRDRPERAEAILRLISLSCLDAQELEDEPVIAVNGREVWSSDSMRTGDSFALDVTSELSTEARIELWERDRGRSDAIGSHTVSIALRGDGSQEHTFSRDRGIVGDATYRLRYEVE